MRWLFLFMLIINVAYVTWEMGKSPDEPHVKKRVASNIPPLVLISELQPSEDGVVDVLKKGDVAVETVEKADEVKEASIAVNEADIKTDADLTDSVSVEVSQAAKPVETIAEKPESPAGACNTLGPFRDFDELRVFTRKIRDYVVDVSFRSREEREISLFWVYLPPEADTKAAHELSKRLINNKIRDYYIITSGDKRNGISLGHFKEKARADSHAKRLKKLGFNPDVEPVFRTYVIYWLDYKNKQGRQIPGEIFKKHMTDRMNKLNRECI